VPQKLQSHSQNMGWGCVKHHATKAAQPIQHSEAHGSQGRSSYPQSQHVRHPHSGGQI